MTTIGFIPSPTSHSFISQRLRLNYLDWGNEGAPILILQHGGRDHAHSWDWMARELCSQWHVIAPDLRGHGDSSWSPDGAYFMPYFVYDFAQLIHQLGVDHVSIVAHSLGANIATRYCGLYPERVRRLVNIEGFGIPSQIRDAWDASPTDINWRNWIDERRACAIRQPRRYVNIDDMFARMQAENPFLSTEQARHLAYHGIARNEDGTWSWKFDNYVRSVLPLDTTEIEDDLWQQIICPVLLLHGGKSWAIHPEKSGKAKLLRNGRTISFDRSGHWPHHDQFADVLREIKAFL